MGYTFSYIYSTGKKYIDNIEHPPKRNFDLQVQAGETNPKSIANAISSTNLGENFPKVRKYIHVKYKNYTTHQNTESEKQKFLWHSLVKTLRIQKKKVTQKRKTYHDNS